MVIIICILISFAHALATEYTAIKSGSKTEMEIELKKYEFVESLKSQYGWQNINFPPVKIFERDGAFFLGEKNIQPNSFIPEDLFDLGVCELAQLITLIGAEHLSGSDICISDQMYVIEIGKHITDLNIKNDIKAVTNLLLSMPLKTDIILNAIKAKTDIEYPRVDPSVAGSIYRMLAVIHKVFTENNLPYWAVAGTYLGALRHRGIIPWDDDGDIQILAKDYLKLMRLKIEFDKYGYELLHYGVFAPKLRLKAEYRRHSNPDFPSVDIFLAIQGLGLGKHDLRDRYYYGSRARSVWPNEYWLKRELFQPSGELNLKEVKFGPNVISVVNAQEERYCTTAFGKYCFDWAKQTSNHEDGGNLSPLETFVVTREGAEFTCPPEWGNGEIDFDHLFNK